MSTPSARRRADIHGVPTARERLRIAISIAISSSIATSTPPSLDAIARGLGADDSDPYLVVVPMMVLLWLRESDRRGTTAPEHLTRARSLPTVYTVRTALLLAERGGLGVQTLDDHAAALGISRHELVRRLLVMLFGPHGGEAFVGDNNVAADLVEAVGEVGWTQVVADFASLLLLLALVLLSQVPTRQALVVAPRLGAPPGADRSPRARRLALTARSSSSGSEAGHVGRPPTGGGTASITA